MMLDVLKIDDIDKMIIHLIQKQPNLTHTQIAKKVNRSQPTVGMRIRKLEELGVLTFQAGINLKSADMYFANIEIQAKNPLEIYDLANKCPFMLNCFRISGDFNIIVLMASFTIKDLEKIVNVHFRSNPGVIRIKINMITDVMKDFVVPFSFQLDCECSLKNHCYSTEE